MGKLVSNMKYFLQKTKYTFAILLTLSFSLVMHDSYALSPTKNISTLDTIEAIVHGGASVQSIIGPLLVGSQYPLSLATPAVLQVVSKRDAQLSLVEPIRPAIFGKSFAATMSNSFFTVLQNAHFASKVFIGFSKENFQDKGTAVSPNTTEWDSITQNSPTVPIPLQRLNVRGTLLATNLNGLSGNVTGQNAVCVDAQGTLVLCQPKDPVVDFRFDECAYTTNPGSVVDASGNITNATAYGGIGTAGLGRVGRRLELTNNVSQRIGASDTRFAVNLGEQMTLSTWVRMTGDPINGESWIVDAHNNCVGWSLSVNTGGAVKARLDSGTGCGNISSAIQIGSNANILADANWHHVALVIDRINHEIKLYIDGNSSAFTYLQSSGVSSLDTLVSIGNNQSSSAAFQNGSLDEFKIYRNVLTHVEIRELYLTEKSKVRDISC